MFSTNSFSIVRSTPRRGFARGASFTGYSRKRARQEPARDKNGKIIANDEGGTYSDESDRPNYNDGPD